MATPQVLTTWKEIAAYLGKGVRTVQRWEEELGLPVHRPGEDRHIVLSFPEELDNWAKGKVAGKIAIEASQTRRRELQRMRALMRDLLQNTVATRHNAAAIMARCKATMELRENKQNRLGMLSQRDSTIELAPAPESDSRKELLTGTD